jgi:hypothetical protein
MTFSKESTPETLEEDMASLWQGQEELEKAHACLFNLVVYAECKVSADYLKQCLQSLMEKFPCRVLFVYQCPALPPNTLKVKVSMEYVGKTTGDLVACDFIDFLFSPDQQKKVPYLLLPHFLPDLPVYMLSSEVPTLDDETLAALRQMTTRIIFDGSFMKSISHFTEEILPKVSSGKLEYIDWNWVQLAGWREILLQIMDTEQRIHQLSQTKSFEITYNTHGAMGSQRTESQALYIVAWLASRLNWSPKGMKVDGQKFDLLFSGPSKDVCIKLTPLEDPEQLPGEILKIDLSTWNDHFFLFMRKEKQFQVIVHISTLDTCELPIALPLTHSNHGYRFWRDIFYQPVSNHYIEMLKVLHTCATLKS